MSRKDKKKKAPLAQIAAEHEKKKLKKKIRQTVRRVVGGVCCGAMLLGTGYFLGVHHRVIEAYLKGGEMPAAPKGHCCR